MPPRVVSLLLAFVLLWSAVAMTQQRFALSAVEPAQDQHQIVEESRPASFNGSIDEHQIDDQPSQPHGALDLAAFLDLHGSWKGLLRGMTRPSQAVQLVLPSPILEGPQRPPRAASVLLA